MQLCGEHNLLNAKNVNNGALRAAIFGVNDGLVSNLSIIMALAGAGASAKIILLTGISGLLAGAFSMAIGEFISMTAQKEVAESLIKTEKEELEEFPEAEKQELEEIYIKKGLKESKAKKLSEIIMADRDLALETHAREELGLNIEELGSPIAAAISSFLFFAIGAIIPLIPYFITIGNTAFIVSVFLSALSLAIIGASLSAFAGKGGVLGALRMLLLGTLAAVATYISGFCFQAVSG